MDFDKIPKIKQKVKVKAENIKKELTKIADDPILKNKISKMLNLKYQYGFLKALNVLLLNLIVFLLLFSMIFSCSIISLFLMICIGTIAMKQLNFSTLIFINIVIVLLFTTQYGLGVSNLNPNNSPMDFPTPFDSKQLRDDLNIPWYSSVYFFTMDSCKWAYYFSLMISYDRILTLWYYGLILLLINIYFTNFYSTIFTENIDISNDKNIREIIRSESENLIDDYEAQYQKQKLNASLDEKDIIENMEKFKFKRHKIQKISDDEIDNLTARFYSSSWTFKIYNSFSNTLCCLSGLLILIFILIATFQLPGIINFAYSVFCLYHIFNFRRFLSQKEYTLPNHLKYVKYFVYFDLLINISYQVPIDWLHYGDNKNSWQKVIGIFCFSYVGEESNQLIFEDTEVIILKAFIFCFVILLDSLIKTSDYKVFCKEKLPLFQEISQSKGICLTYLYNNNKLRELVKIQYEKEAMAQKIKLMKQQLHSWNRKYLSASPQSDKKRYSSMLSLFEKPTGMLKYSDTKSLKSFNFDLKPINEQNEESSKFDIQQMKIEGNLQRDDKDDSLSKHSSFVDLIDPQADGGGINLEEEEICLNQLKQKHLGWLTRIFNWIKRKYSNQMLLKSSKSRIKFIEADLKRGKYRINTTLENKLLINHYTEKDQAAERINMLNSTLPDMMKFENKKLKEGSSKDLHASYLTTIISIIVSNSSILCYIFMVLAHIMNGSLLSLVYPVSIFCYALLEEIRPPKEYWKFILFYTMIVLILKSFIKAYYISNNIPDTINSLLMNLRIGIQKVDDSNLPSSYFVFEVLIMLFVVVHMMSLMLQGLWDKREIDIETVEQATVRIINNAAKHGFRKMKSTKTYKNSKLYRSYSDDLVAAINSIDNDWRSNESFRSHSRFDDEEDEIRFVDVLPPKKKKTGNPFKGHFENTMASRWRDFKTPMMIDLDPMYCNPEELPDKALIHEVQRSLTEYPYDEITYDAAQNFIDEEIKNKGIFQNYYTQTKRKLFKNQYFKRLFPSITTMKPGKDFYAQMAFIQFLIIVFIILFFSFMERDYTNITSQKLQIKQFSALLVVAVFVQIFIMLVDRYIYISKSFTVYKSEEEEEQFFDDFSNDQINVNEINNQNDSEKIKQMKIDITSNSARSILVNLYEQMTKSSHYFLKSKKSELLENCNEQSLMKVSKINKDEFEKKKTSNIHEINLELLKNKNTSIKLKYYLQWGLVIFINVVIFWFLPSKSNYAAQGHLYCDKASSIDLKCNEVNDNSFLIMFYLLYCIYFYLSALQICYGYPELKKGNFLMKHSTSINRIGFQTFRAIPFLLELKIFSDWSFTRTSLDVFQWIKFDNIYGDLFIAKCINKGYVDHKLGAPISKLVKFLVGILGTLGLVAIIAGPMLLFSTLNPIAQDNPVTGMILDLSIEVNITSDGGIINKYGIFHNDHVTKINDISDSLYSEMKLGGDILTKNIKRNLMQEIRMSSTADTSWDIAPPAQNALFNEIYSSFSSNSTGINLRLTYSFSRKEPAGNQIVSSSTVVDLTEIDDKNQTIIKALISATNVTSKCDPDRSISFKIPKFYIPTINVYATGDPEVISIERLSADIIVSKSCDVVDGSSKPYWGLSQKNWGFENISGIDDVTANGLVFVTVSEKITPSYLANYSIIGFYTIIVYAIGALLRRGLFGTTERIFISDMPRPDSLLLLCEGILISRLENNTEREEELYYILIDIVRSPEVIKMITDSSIKKKID